jgi:hypothetical protein
MLLTLQCSGHITPVNNLAPKGQSQYQRERPWISRPFPGLSSISGEGVPDTQEHMADCAGHWEPWRSLTRMEEVGRAESTASLSSRPRPIAGSLLVSRATASTSPTASEVLPRPTQGHSAGLEAVGQALPSSGKKKKNLMAPPGVFTTNPVRAEITRYKAAYHPVSCSGSWLCSFVQGS